MTAGTVQSRTSQVGAADSLALAYSGSIGSGNLLVVAFALDNNAGTAVTVSDNLTHTWYQAGSALQQSTGQLHVYYAYNSTAGACTVTVNPNGASANIQMAIHEINSIQTSPTPFDKTAGTIGSGTAVNSGNTTTTASANELIFGAMSHYSSAQTINKGATFTEFTEVESAAIMPIATEYKSVTSTGVQAADWTTGGAVDWMARVVTFIEAGASTPTLTMGEGTQAQTGDAAILTAQYPFAYNGFSQATEGTGNLSWTHTPTAPPRGVLVFIAQNVGTTSEVTAVTYGGSALAQVTSSPVAGNTTEPGMVYGFFLGSAIPPGAQTVAITVSNTSVRAAGVYAISGNNNLQVITTGTINNNSLGTPTLALNLGGTNAFVAEGFHAGPNAVSGITPFAGWTGSYEYDYTSQTAGFYKYDTVGTANVNVGWTQAADDAHLLAVAIAEILNVTPTITTAEGTQAQAGDAVIVQALYSLTVPDGAQAQSGDAALVVFLTGIAPSEGTQAQIGDAVSIKYLAVASPTDGAQAQAGDAAVLTALTNLVTAKGAQSQTGDAVSLKGLTNLSAAEGAQSQTMDTVIAAQVTILATSEGAQTQTGDAITLTALYTLAFAEGAQSQAGDAVSVAYSSPGSANVTVAEGTQAQAGDAVTITAIYKITASEGAQAQAQDAVLLGGMTNLTASEGVQAQASDAVTAKALYPLIIGEGVQAQGMDIVTAFFSGYIPITVGEGMQTQGMDAAYLSLYTALFVPGFADPGNRDVYRAQDASYAGVGQSARAQSGKGYAAGHVARAKGQK